MEHKATIKSNGKPVVTNERLASLQRVITGMISRSSLAQMMGVQYNGKRNIYEALGYPDDKDLTFDYFFAKYGRQDLSAAIIDRPVDKTWNGTLEVVEPDTKSEESLLLKEWETLDKELKIKRNLLRVDKLAGLGRFALLLMGFNDVSKQEDFITPVGGAKLKLLYVKPIGEGSVTISEWETNAGNERYGMPNQYKVIVGEPGNEGSARTIQIHHSRVLHIKSESLQSDVYGRPRLKPIINRLLDMEKLLGGDAEMFWRGARPGYTALTKDDYDMGEAEVEQLEDELDKYEHDLRRFIKAQGVDIKALEQQVADPINHIDAQLQAISAQTSIPKRILVGSERGELSSTQDQNQWLSLITTRRDEFAEMEILRPFIDKCMEHGVLPMVEDYNTIWEDLFALSDKDKVDLGKVRSESLASYANSIGAADVIPPPLAGKYLLGLTDEQMEEIAKAVEEQVAEEEENVLTPEEENAMIEEARRLKARQDVPLNDPVEEIE